MINNSGTVKRGIGVLILAGMSFISRAQDYHAIAGSNYAGALGVHNNPASIVNTPYPWDITLVGLQAKYQTNAIRVMDYSLLSKATQSKYYVSSGNFSRKGNEQFNLNLLNTRFAWGRKTAFAFGANLRSFADVKSSKYNYVDTIVSVNEFFSLNPGADLLSVKARTSTWLELYGSVARTIIEHPEYRLNAGVTAKVNRGLAGGRGDVVDMRRERVLVGDEQQYILRDGRFSYGYSANIDRWNSNNSTMQNLRNLFSGSYMGLSMDAGLELLIKPVSGPMDDEESYYDYDWKIGASFLDVGFTHYRYGTESRAGSIPAAGVSGNRMDEAFLNGIPSAEAFSDSVTAVFGASPLRGEYRIWMPARIVLNVDRFVTDAFYVNAELNINIVRLLGEERLYLNNLNGFRLTPRWETRLLGFYLPFLYNTQNQFWVGAGVKLGPLMVGVHNLGNLLGKTSMARGGGYIALSIRPGKKVTGAKRYRGLDCPPL